MYTINSVGAVLGSDAYLLTTPTHAALIDTGFAFAAKAMLSAVASRLGDRSLDYILLTHSHYDHASGSVAGKKRWPEAQIVASAYAAKILAKESARDVIRTMNDHAAREHGVFDYEDLLADLTVDRTVADGDLVDMGDLQLRVLELPGHTRCSIGFYDEPARLLLGCETLGVISGPGLVMPCCLVDYNSTRQAIARVRALAVDHLLLPHHGLIEGEECRRFLADADFWLSETRRRLQAAHDQGKQDDELLQLLKQWFYTDLARLYQPEKAFDLNARYTIALMLKKDA